MTTDVRVEEAKLSDDHPMMYRDFGTKVRMAYDPAQISEAEALARLCIRIPRLVGGGLRVLHVTA